MTRRLSPAQKRVADLLKEGMSDREIAHRLGLAVRTVSVHMSAIMARLDAKNRTQAPVILVRREMSQ